MVVSVDIPVVTFINIERTIVTRAHRLIVLEWAMKTKFRKCVDMGINKLSIACQNNRNVDILEFLVSKMIKQTNGEKDNLEILC